MALIQAIFIAENAKTPMAPRDIVEYVQENFKKNVSASWPQGFVEQHSKQLAIVEAFPLENNRIEIKRKDIEQYCRDVDEKICQYDWRLIYNWDECGLDDRTDVSKMVVVSKRNESKKVYFKSTRSSGHVTIFPGICLDGMDFPPLIIMTSKTMDNDLKQFGFPNSHMGYLVSTKTGFNNADCMLEYVKNVIVPFCDQKRKFLELVGHRVLILQDSMSAHIDDRVQKELNDNGIDTFEFVPHSSHFCQPCDNGTFRSLKNEMTKGYVTPFDLTDRSRHVIKLVRALERSTGAMQNRSSFFHAGFDFDLEDKDFPLRLNEQFLLQSEYIPKPDIFLLKPIRNPVREGRTKLNYFKSKQEKSAEKRKATEESQGQPPAKKNS